MDEMKKKVVLMIGIFTMIIGFLWNSYAFACTMSDSLLFSNNDGRPYDYSEYTLLVASDNGQDTDRACNLLNHCLMADKGVNTSGCISGLSVIDGDCVPDNLTICDVGDGRIIPKKLRHADVLVLVYGGDEKNKDRGNFENLHALHKRLMSRMLDDPQCVTLNLDTIYMASVSYEDEVEMASILHAERVDSAFLKYLNINRDLWIRYRGKTKAWSKKDVFPNMDSCITDD